MEGEGRKKKKKPLFFFHLTGRFAARFAGRQDISRIVAHSPFTWRYIIYLFIDVFHSCCAFFAGGRVLLSYGRAPRKMEPGLTPDLVPQSRYLLKRIRLLSLSPSTSFLFPVERNDQQRRGCHIQCLLRVGEREVCLKSSLVDYVFPPPPLLSQCCSSVSTGSIAPHAFLSGHEASPIAPCLSGWFTFLKWMQVLWLLSLGALKT